MIRMKTNKHKKLDLSLIGKFLGCPDYLHQNEEKIKRCAEEKFVVLVPQTGAPILDRSYLSDHQSEFFRLPKSGRDYLMDIFLTVKIPGYEHQETDIPAVEDLPEPSNSVTKTSRRNTKFLPQLFQALQKSDSKTQPLILEELLNSFGASNFEKELCQVFRDFWMQDQIKIKDGNNTILFPFIVKLRELLILKEGERKSINELLFLWIVTNLDRCRLFSIIGIMRQMKVSAMGSSGSLFHQQFAALVPKTSSFFLINRSYYVENRSAIEALSNDEQRFIQKSMLTAPTMGHEAHKKNITYPDGFYIAYFEPVVKFDTFGGAPDKFISALVQAGIYKELILEIISNSSKEAVIRAMILSELRDEDIALVRAASSEKELISALKAPIFKRHLR